MTDARAASGRAKPAWPRRLLLVLVPALLVAALVFAVGRAQRLPDGPVEPVWDREPCAHCRMHLSERAFAAQIQAKDGRVLFFDDPGCLLQYEKEHPLEEHAVYFHELRGPGWVARDQVGFVTVTPTPMGYGLGAVAKGAPGAITIEAAREKVARGVDATDAAPRTP